MKILLAQNSLYIPTHGGGNKANRLWLEGLVGKGHSCRAVARSTGAQGARTRTQFLEQLAAHDIDGISSASGVDMFHYQGVEVCAVTNVVPLRDELVQQIRTFEPTWVLVSSADPGQILLEAALHTCPGRVIYIAHTPQMFPFGPESFWPNPAGTELLRLAAAIVAIGPQTAAHIQHYTGLNPVIIHPPIYGSGPFPNYCDHDQGCITLVNPSAVKGLPIFVALAKSLPECQFAALTGWATTSADRETLAKLANVQVWEAVKDIDEAFAKTRILLVPSLYQEGFGLTVTEAMLRGIPVLASDYGGLRDAKLGVDYLLPIRPIERYEARYDDRHYPIPLIPKQDISPWLDALQSLLSDRQHYAQLARSSRQAALAFVSRLGIEAFEDFLQNSTPALQTHAKEPSVSSHVQGQRREQSDTMHELQEHLAKLSPERRALLALRLRK